VTVLIPDGVASNSSLNYNPSNVVLVIGINNTVQWFNYDTTKNVVHTVTFTQVPPGFNATASSISSSASPGIPYGVYYGPLLLAAPGVYKYHCFYHPWMAGTITVKP
jgi:plastocyanin